METHNDEISLKELLEKIKQLYRYLLSQWKIILFAGILGASLGLTYSIVNKPLYIATLTFALEDDKQVSGLGSIASTFGIDVGSSGGSAFSGSNLIELFKSRAIISQTLMRPIVSKNDTISLIEMYLQINGYRESWNNNPKLKGIQFPPLTKRKYFTRVHDSIMGKIYINLTKSKLTVGQQEDKGSLTAIEFKSENEEFTKAFCEALAEEVSQFYVDTKSKKARLNTAILQKQMDSIRIELNKSITEVAVGNDNTFMLNPALNVKRTPSTRRQIDVQSNTALLNELVKQTEIAKVALRKETPLIQVVDRPVLPLPKYQFGKYVGIFLGWISVSFIVVLFLIIKRIIIQMLN